jgi:ribulose 1,5-bisphosphate synthetase/thiazole synthase
MKSNKNIVLIVLTSILLITSFCSKERSTKKYDVVIYGGTSGGISAAIQTSRMGKSVVLIEPSGDWEDSLPVDLAPQI